MEAMEYGCGTGLITLMLADKLQKITAIDISAEMLELLKAKITNRMISNIKICQIDQGR